MSLALVNERRAPAIALAAGAAALAVLAAAVAAPRVPPLQVVPVIALLAAAALTHRTLLAWRVLLPFLLLTIMFVPIRRYAFPGSLPFELSRTAWSSSSSESAGWRPSSSTHGCKRDARAWKARSPCC